jgi:FAD/FMN-containing dehydrogenase
MSSLNPWNSIPKISNSKITKYTSSESFKFSSETTHLPRGLGRSYGDVCLNNDGSLILTLDNNSIVHFDYEKGLIECESGISLNEILKIIVPQGWFLPVVPGTSFVTIGGAIANDIHGKNHHKNGSFGNYVESIDLLRSNGEVKTCTKKENNEFFRATIGGLGLTGLIIKAKIKLIPIKSKFVDSKNIRYHSLDEFFAINDELEKNNEYTVSFVDLALSKKNNNIRGVYHVGKHADYQKELNKNVFKTTDLSLRLPFPSYVSVVNNFSINLVNRGYYFINRNNDWSRQHYKNFFFQLDSLKNWNKAYGKKGFYQYQFVIPKSNAQEVIKDIIKILKFYNQKPVLAVLKTFGNVKSVGMMSFPTEGVTLAIDVQNKGTTTLKMLSKLDLVIMKAGGRLYPAKDARMNKAIFLKSFPNFSEFEKYIDPLFSSSFLKRINNQ